SACTADSSKELRRDTLTSNCVGDVNSDGQRTVTDVVRLLNYIVGNAVLTSNEIAAADVNANGSVTVNDAILLQNSLVGNSTLPACSSTALPWSKAFGGTGQDYGLAVAVDHAGNVVLTGYFSGSMDFGGGPLACSNTSNIVLAKYSAAGTHIWSKCFLG